jgi:hypothetical protein
MKIPSWIIHTLLIISLGIMLWGGMKECYESTSSCPRGRKPIPCPSCPYGLNQQKFPSKFHLWADGLWILGLALFLQYSNECTLSF